MDCVTSPTATIFSTPAEVQTVQRTITTVTSIPGAVYSMESFSVQCDNAGCVSGAVTSIYTDYMTIATTVITDELITSAGVPVPIETQYGSSCFAATTSSTPTSTPTPTSAPTLSLTSGFAEATQSSSLSSPAPSATVAVSHKSTNVGAIAGGAAAGVVALVVLIFLVFKVCRGKGRDDRRTSVGYGGEKRDHHSDLESVGAKGYPYSPGDSLATPTGKRDQYNAKSRDSKSSYFGAGEAAADQPANNAVAARLSVPGSEKQADSIALAKLPTDSTPPTMTKPLSFTPGAAGAGRPATNKIAAALSASGPTSEKAASSIATDKIPTKSASSAPEATGADQPAANPVAAALSASGPTSEKMATLIAKDKIRTNSTSPTRTKSSPAAAGPPRSPSVSQTKPESSSSTPQPADPPTMDTASSGSPAASLNRKDSSTSR